MLHIPKNIGIGNAESELDATPSRAKSPVH